MVSREVYPNNSVCSRVCCFLGRPQVQDSRDSTGTSRESALALQVMQRFRDVGESGGVITLSPPDEFCSYFQVMNNLGEGGFGTVFQVKPLGNALLLLPALTASATYAVKQIRLPQDDQDVEEIEKSGLKVPLERHQEVIKLMQSQQTSQQHVLMTFAKMVELPSMLYIVMELLQGPDLLDFLIEEGKPLSEDEAAELTRQMLVAVQHLHRVVGVVHRDVKPENFGFSSKAIRPLPALKLFDFGLVTILPAPVSEDTASDLVRVNVGGTPAWMAPEAWQKKCGAATDVWGVGMIMHALLMGNVPFNMQNCVDLKDYPKALEKYDLKLQSEALSADARDLLEQLLAKDSRKRISTQQALDRDWLARTDRVVSFAESDMSIETASTCASLSDLPSRTKRLGDGTYHKACTVASLSESPSEAKCLETGKDRKFSTVASFSQLPAKTKRLGNHGTYHKSIARCSMGSP
eukprot:TRINITY_DN106555_c0_g1_i1.p1 TRINITY_DN106555_c0_g1~~TRINITY_DN106555_c0_g1_i1.p1  ORF type:complete len:464 (-),score=92.57 TRINITY_DN106555_c0_g1_i1:176-1567(-)